MQAYPLLPEPLENFTTCEGNFLHQTVYDMNDGLSRHLKYFRLACVIELEMPRSHALQTKFHNKFKKFFSCVF